jgi:hypothetical protein
MPRATGATSRILAAPAEPDAVTQGAPDAPPRRRWQGWMMIGLGWSLVLLGLAGLVLPFLQGVLLLALGLIVLAREHSWAARLLHRLKQRFPRLAAAAERGEERAKAMTQRITEWLGRSRR